MTDNELINDYKRWMYQLVYGELSRYHRLFDCLYGIEFTYTIPMDGNRADDGIALRYRYGYERNISDAVIASVIDIRPCSVLEMMVALSIRCEEHIMDDPEFGDRTGLWFRNMTKSLGLYNMIDSDFNEQKVRRRINLFLNRAYFPDGRGGLFTIRNCPDDVRQVEIWCQMNWYLDALIKEY